MNSGHRFPVPDFMGRFCLFRDLLETDMDVCFLTIVRPTLVILLSCLFAIIAFCPRWDVILTRNIGSHRKPSSDLLSQGVRAVASPTTQTPQHKECWKVIYIVKEVFSHWFILQYSIFAPLKTSCTTVVSGFTATWDTVLLELCELVCAFKCA